MSWVSDELPTGARTTTYAVPAGPLAAVELAPDAPRGTAVLVPGYSGSKEDFGPLLAPLAGDGWRVVALDLRGQCGSTGPDDPAAYTVGALATDVLGVLDLLSGPVHLVGHSFGGLVCRDVALRAPGRLASLTLLCSGPAGLRGPRMDVLALLPAVLAEGGVLAVADAADQLAELDPQAREVPARTRDFQRRRWLAASGTGLVAMAEALRDEPDRVEALRATGVPTLVLHGADDDAWAPAVQADMADRLGAAYAVVPGARHSPAVEEPEATAAQLRGFWSAV